VISGFSLQLSPLSQLLVAAVDDTDRWELTAVYIRKHSVVCRVQIFVSLH
jgi:hypothetical protein